MTEQKRLDTLAPTTGTKAFLVIYREVDSRIIQHTEHTTHADAYTELKERLNRGEEAVIRTR